MLANWEWEEREMQTEKETQGDNKWFAGMKMCSEENFKIR